jgi:hypothetical protein
MGKKNKVLKIASMEPSMVNRIFKMYKSIKNAIAKRGRLENSLFLDKFFSVKNVKEKIKVNKIVMKYLDT